MDNGNWSNERISRIQGVEIAYQTMGQGRDAPLLLVSGLGTQMIGWLEDFCRGLVEQGYFLIRFDNRDVGHSSRFDEAGVPNALAAIQSWLHGMPMAKVPPYTLRDMAADTIGVLDALQIESAHLLGISLGGMIAQVMSIHFPERIRTLSLLMTSTCDPALPQPLPEALRAITSKPAGEDRESYIQHTLQISKTLSGPAMPIDEAYTRDRAGRSYDRGVSSGGAARQIAAAIASIGWKAALGHIQIPTAVFHGDVDPLFPLACGEDVTKAIPGSRMITIENMGHAFTAQAWPWVTAGMVGLREG